MRDHDEMTNTVQVAYDIDVVLKSYADSWATETKRFEDCSNFQPMTSGLIIEQGPRIYFFPQERLLEAQFLTKTTTITPEGVTTA